MAKDVKYVVAIEDESIVFDNKEDALEYAQEELEYREEQEYVNYKIEVLKVETKETIIKTYITKGA